MLKISIVTVCYNSEKYIESAIQSVLNQSYKNIEYIIIDGKSNDNTLSIIKKYGTKISKVVSEPDKGIYDAMNKGYKLATGDVIGILNSDDFLSNEFVVDKIVKDFKDNASVDAVYGDIIYVNSKDLSKTVRYYSSRHFKLWLFRFGMMPPHASFYARKDCFDKYGLYKTNYKIAADLDLIIRLLKVKNLKSKYLNFDVVTMRLGGLSTNSFESKKLLNKETVQVCKENGIYTNYFLLMIKYVIKVVEMFFFKKKR